MQEETIIITSKIGQRLDAIEKKEQVSYLMFNDDKIHLVNKITIGRAVDNDVVIGNKLASRHHALIQKIRDDYFLKDLDSVNGTWLNDNQISAGKYYKLQSNDTLTIGKTNLIIS